LRFCEEGIDQGWRIAGGVRQAIGASGEWAATREVGKGAIATSGDASLLIDQVPGATVARLPSEGPGQWGGERFCDIDDRVADLECVISIPLRLDEEKSGETGFQK
jgi:hypothetical protein